MLLQMNTQIMEHDVHSPAFIRAKDTSDKPKVEPAKPKRGINWRGLIDLTLLLSLVVVAVYFISRLITPQVVTAIGILVGFLLLRFVVKTILQITFTLLGYLFWIAVIGAILLCVL